MSDQAAPAVEQPSAEEISRFVECFELLGSFEAQSVMIRGYGAFGPDWQKPEPSVVRVLDWLKRLTADTSST